MMDEKKIETKIVNKIKESNSEPKPIYIEVDSRLIKIEEIKIVWSNFHQSYKLITGKD